MVTTFYPPYHFGGDATYVRALSRELVKRGHEVEVVHCKDSFHMLSQHQPVEETDTDDGILVHRLKSRFGPLSPLLTQQTGHPALKSGKLKRILANNFDVVHFHNISLVGGPFLLGMNSALITLYTLHEHWLVCPTHIFWKNKSQACDQKTCFTCSLRSGILPQLWRYTALTAKAIRNVDRFFSPSEYTAQKHRESEVFSGEENRIQVFPLFSTLDPGKPPDYVPPARAQFVFAGRITASKGVAQMIETFAKIPEVDLTVVGNGDLLETLQQKYSKNRNIFFKGKIPQSELIQIYQSATAVILPSIAPETFGLTIAEGFACGTPAIVRYAGGSRDLVDITGAGFVYESDAELESRVKQLASDHKLRKNLGRKAREGYLRYYTPERHMETYTSEIDRLYKKKKEY